jgi:CheY-like chemotaxis protein
MASPTPRPPGTRPCQVLTGKRALVVGGYEAEHARLRESLSNWGIAAEITTDPLHGLAMLWAALEGTPPFHWALFDPRGHLVLGEQFAALVRSEPRLADLPMLHIGEAAGTGGKRVLRRVGFFDTVAVPIDKTLLFDTLHRACGTLVTTTGVVRLMDRHAALGPSTPRLDILLAEQTPEQCRIVRNALARGGHQIFEVLSGEQALDALTKHRFDVVILDLDLPGLSAAGTLKLLAYAMAQEDWPAFIGLARAPTVTQIRDYAGFGITVILPSPIQPRALLEAIADVIRAGGEGTGTTPNASTSAFKTPTDGTCLDEQTLNELDALGSDPNFLYDLTQEFLADVGDLLEGVLRTQGTSQCYPRLREFGHLLQDNAGSLGALQLYQLGLIAAQYPEDTFDREGDQFLKRIESAYQRTRGAFWQYLRRHALARSPG